MMVIIPPRQDRTGFTEFFALSGVLLLTSFGLFFMEYSKLSVFFGVIGIIAFTTAEGTSRPPRFGPHEFVKQKQNKNEDHDNIMVEVLVCLGDSLTHGACSANWVDTILPKLRDKQLQQHTLDDQGSVPSLAVVNAGQNSICTETVLQTKVQHVIACRPNYIFIMIGTNDVRGIYRKDWANDLIRIWKLGECPSADGLVQNLISIIKELLLKCTKAKIAVGTLPPLGEDINSRANQLIQRVNKCIVQAIEKDFGGDDNTTTKQRRVSILDINGALWKQIINKQYTTKRKTIHSIDDFLLAAMVMGVLRNLFGTSWNTLTNIITGNVVLSESLHLNETGGDVVRDEVVKWLSESGASIITASDQNKKER